MITASELLDTFVEDRDSLSNPACRVAGERFVDLLSSFQYLEGVSDFDELDELPRFRKFWRWMSHAVADVWFAASRGVLGEWTLNDVATDISVALDREEAGGFDLLFDTAPWNWDAGAMRGKWPHVADVHEVLASPLIEHVHQTVSKFLSVMAAPTADERIVAGWHSDLSEFVLSYLMLYEEIRTLDGQTDRVALLRLMSCCGRLYAAAMRASGTCARCWMHVFLENPGRFDDL